MPEDIANLSLPVRPSSEEDVFRYHAMDALDAIDYLRHLEIDRDAGERVGILARQPLLAGEEVDRFTDRHLHRLFEILMQAERDPMRRRLGARPAQGLALDQIEPEGSRQRRLDRRQIDLTVALGGMAIAAHEQGAGNVNRQIESRPDREVLEIDVAAERAGRTGADLAEAARRTGRHDAEERPQRYLDLGSEFGDLSLEVEGNDDAAVERELVRQATAVHPHRVDAIRRARRCLEHAHREHVARLGALDINWTGNDVATESTMLHLGVDGDRVGEDLLGGNAEAVEEPDGIALIAQQALMRDRVDGDLVARLDDGDRLLGTPQIAPMHRLRAAADHRLAGGVPADEA